MYLTGEEVEKKSTGLLQLTDFFKKSLSKILQFYYGKKETQKGQISFTES